MSVISTGAMAHSGGTDKYGCHAGFKPYHCHSTPVYLNNVKLVKKMLKHFDESDFYLTADSFLDSLDLKDPKLPIKLLMFLDLKEKGFSNNMSVLVIFGYKVALDIFESKE